MICERESRKARDAFAIALWKDRVIVGHVPHTISSMCMQFLRNGGTIISKVTGPRRYSHDLTQGNFHAGINLLDQTM